MKKKELMYAGLLLLTSLIWGFCFAFQSMGMDHVGPLSFNMARAFLACAALTPVTLLALRKEPLRKEEIVGGMLCGCVTCAGNTLQQIGLLDTSVGKAGFITALYVLMVPLIGLLKGERIRKQIWLWVLMAVTGMYFLCLPSGDFSLQKGDLLLLGTALLYAVQIRMVDYYSDRGRGIILNYFQFLMCFALSTLIMLPFERFDLGLLWQARIPLLYAGVVSCGIGYTLQFVAQKEVKPITASLIMCLESVFSALGGWLLLSQKLSLREMLGCMMIFLAIVLCQLTDNLAEKA